MARLSASRSRLALLSAANWTGGANEVHPALCGRIERRWRRSHRTALTEQRAFPPEGETQHHVGDPRRQDAPATRDRVRNGLGDPDEGRVIIKQRHLSAK